MMFQTAVDLTGLNTLASPSRADYFFSFTSGELLLMALEQRPEKLPCIVLGGGSNIVLTSDVNAVILKNSMQGHASIGEDDASVWVKVAGGVLWHDLVQWSIRQRHSGLENLSLIPGTVGAAPIQNIGAYGVELCDVFEALEAIEIETGRKVSLNKQQCDFSYRHSIFKTEEYAGKWVIVSVTFRLNKTPQFVTGYGEIEAELSRRNVSTITSALMGDIIVAIRQRKLPDPVALPNVGSFFKNPIVASAELQRIKRFYPDVVCYPLEGGRIKLAAGWMIDRLGWKGRQVDGAKVHENQALVLINVGGGGVAVLALARKIQQDVSQAFGVLLEPEPKIIGSSTNKNGSYE